MIGGSMPTRKLNKLTQDDVLDKNEVRALLEAPDVRTRIGKRDFAILRLFLATGFRMAELLSLNVGDLKKGETNFYIQVKSKGGDLLSQPLKNLEALKAISEYFLAWGHGDKKSQPLFISSPAYNFPGPNRLSRNALTYLVKKYSKKARIQKNVHPHTLRHTFGTHFYQATKDPVATQKAMRHKAFSSTLIYIHLDDSAVLEGLDKLGF